MDPVSLNAMTTEIANALDWVGFVFNRHFVGLHSLLNFGPNIIKANVDACSFYSRVCGVLTSF